MPTKSKDTLSATIRALPEFQKAARSYLQESHYTRQAIWKRLGDDYAFDYLHQVGIETALMVANRRHSQWQEAARPLFDLKAILDAAPDKRYVTIEDVPVGSDTHRLWSENPENILSLFEIKPWQYSGRQDIGSDRIARGWVMDAALNWGIWIDQRAQTRDDLEAAKVAVERLNRMATASWMESRRRSSRASALVAA